MSKTDECTFCCCPLKSNQEDETPLDPETQVSSYGGNEPSVQQQPQSQQVLEQNSEPSLTDHIYNITSKLTSPSNEEVQVEEINKKVLEETVNPSRKNKLDAIKSLKVALRLSKKLDIRILGLHLGIESHTLDNIFQNNKDDITEAAYEMLKEWRKRQPSETEGYQSLLAALKHHDVNRLDIVQDVFGETVNLDSNLAMAGPSCITLDSVSPTEEQQKSREDRGHTNDLIQEQLDEIKRAVDAKNCKKEIVEQELVKKMDKTYKNVSAKQQASQELQMKTETRESDALQSLLNQTRELEQLKKQKSSELKDAEKFIRKKESDLEKQEKMFNEKVVMLDEEVQKAKIEIKQLKESVNSCHNELKISRQELEKNSNRCTELEDRFKRYREFDNMKKLTDKDVENLSPRLLQEPDIMRLGKRLGLQSNTIKQCFAEHGEDYPGAAHDMLTQWRQTQEDDFIAYDNLCKALVDPTVNLKKIAKDLGFRPSSDR